MNQPTLRPCLQVWQDMTHLTQEAAVYNYTALLDLEDATIITPLFPQAALEAYSRYNLGDAPLPGDATYFNQQRGGHQGDYRAGMDAKIANIISCLRQFPASKRAVITIANDAGARHDDDSEAKCMRLLQLRYDQANHTLHGTTYFRAQAAAIFPKNLHFIASLMARIASGISETKPVTLGSLFYVAGVLVADRQ